MILENDPSVRFAHAANSLDSTKCPYTGLTVCYVRQLDAVYFTYALCHKGDQYSKAVGRYMSVATWHSLENAENFNPDESADAYIDYDNRCGFITVGVFSDECGLTQQDNVFSDQHIADIEMFDFKHVFISKVLVDFVIKNAVEKRFPNSKL